MIDLMYELQIVVRLQAMLGHQPAHGSAIALVIVLLDAEGLLVRHFQEIGDKGTDTVVDLLPEIQVMRIERVVEVEHPRFDATETARLWTRRTRHDVTVP